MADYTSKIYISLIAFLLSACAFAIEPYPAPGNPEIFQVGEIEVRLYQDREAMVKDLPPLFALLEATRAGDRQIRVQGYYDSEKKRIYSIDDARVVIHEFKHYLEPHWRHGAESPHTETTHFDLSHR